MAKARLIKRVEVTWIDATLKQGWLSLQQAEKFAKTPLVVQTMGWLIEENKDNIVLGMGVDSEDDFHELFKIPRGCIKKIQRLYFKVRVKCKPKKN